MKKVIISEEMEQEVIGDILTETFYPTSEKVLILKDYLEKNFARQELDDIDSNGYPIKDKTVVMLSQDKQPLKTINISDLLLILDDKFHKMISDDTDRRNFFKQVISDWYYKRISKNGLLTTNHV
jgi:hypothetical protein